MPSSRVLALILLVATACGVRAPRQSPLDASGFLDDYSMLRPGGPDEMALVYRDPTADWTAYQRVLFEPVTLWRSGRGALDAVPEGDLLRLIATLQGAVRRHLGEGFTLVDAPGPGVMLVRLAITEARASDPILDVMNARPGAALPAGDGPLHGETRRFIEQAHIEGEIRDAATGRLLAAGVDRRKRDGARPLATWADVEGGLDLWARRVCGRLEARTHPGR